jgi:hypothetical protein
MIDTTIFQDKTAVYYTLGCKLNFSETSTIGKTLKEAGIRTARKGEKADICVINTCSVTEVAIISVLIVQFRLLVGVAGTDVLKRLWNRRGRLQLKEGRKL